MSDADSQIHAVSIWVDRHLHSKTTRSREEMLWHRIGKIGEEHGEAIAELIALLGANPRKDGPTDDTAALEEELLDVAFTALGALVHVRGTHYSPMNALRVHCDRIYRRAFPGQVSSPQDS